MVHASKALTWLAAPNVGAHPLLYRCQMNLIRIAMPATLPVAHARAYTCIHVYREKRRNKRRVRR